MLRLLIPLLLLSLVAPFAAAQNPATNGGFEEVRDDGTIPGWSILGDVTISDDAHSGQNAVLLRRDTLEGLCGLNREWEADSGERATMLRELKGGVRFYYKALEASEDATMPFYVIAMSAAPMEDTGEMRAEFAIPLAHVGDDQWHVGVVGYDFSENPDVKWVHLSPRLRGEKAALLLDDVEWLPEVGPALSVVGTRWEEDEKRPGQRATLTVRLKNVGDAAAHGATVSVACPEYLSVAGDETKPVPPIGPEGVEAVAFTIDGRRDRADALTISSEVPGSIGEPPQFSFALEPELQVVQLRPKRFILSPGETTTVDAVVKGRGTAICTDITGELPLPDIKVTRSTPEGNESLTTDDILRVVSAPKRLVEVLPGRETVLTWRVKALQPVVAPLGLTVGISSSAGDGAAKTTLVLAPKPKVAPDVPGAHVEEDVAWLQGDGIRLVLQRGAVHFSVADLQVRRGAKWETVARIPWLGRAAVASRSETTPTIWHAAGTPRVDGEALVVEAQPTVGPNPLEFSVRLRLRDSGANIAVTSTLQAGRTCDLYAFDMPFLHVGEGSFGSAKTEALFPGCDWLDADDVSSEDDGRLIDPSHKHAIRYVPDPNMITIPLMSVHHEGTTVGLLWDHRQTWDGTHDRPAAVFASPDRFEGRNAHTMGLFVPSVSEEGGAWVEPNERLAWTPYDLPAGRPVTLESVIYARTDAPDALSAMDEWFRIYGVPEPLPYPNGTFEGELAFSMDAYLYSLWIPEKKMWWNSRGAGKLMSFESRPGHYPHQLLWGAAIVDDPNLRERCLDRANEVLALGGRAQYADDGFDYGGADMHMVTIAAHAMNLMASQGKDGTWRFDAEQKRSGVFEGMDYHELGRDDAAELGTIAASAYQVLRFARLTGSQEAYNAGVKALRAMKNYRVPRAAQVWEVMVHAPDILAAADAVDAYLEAYQYDGREEWLTEAVRWGRGGLPFVYMWDDPEKPYVLGGSIPVFGATWKTGSWYARPVQWNGLRHARAILKLAKVDDSMEWRTFAEHLIVSCLYQQSTDPDDIALWPDSIGAIDGIKSGWIFAPTAIFEPFSMLVGRQLEPDTVILGDLPQRLHLSSGAAISDATWEGNAVSARLTYPSGESGYAVLVNVGRPDAVLLDGEELPEIGILETGDEAGWKYVAGLAMVVVRVTEDGAHELEVSGAPYRAAELLPERRSKLAFEFNSGTEGWMAQHHIADLRLEDGALQVDVNGGDPYMSRAMLTVDGDTVDEVALRMRAPTGTAAQFYWSTVAAPGITEDRVVHFPIQGDGQWREYRLPVGEHAQWRGQTITGIRLDPLQPGVDATVEIDWIRGE